ncbi:MAG: nitroreductase family protein [Gammaproteobacteria bacterium]|nr:nitroreductase family protein [Gammaproteobacteria bacterium]MBD3777270.1 nitroreductase family protein [Thiotrichales bacterium]
MSLAVYQAILQRHSVRAFLDKPVETRVIHRILERTRFAPSGVNTRRLCANSSATLTTKFCSAAWRSATKT